MKKEFILIIGGARSGKTAFSEQIARKKGKKFVYVATLVSLDSEMKERVKKHKGRRSSIWKTIEEPLNILSVLKKEDEKQKVILIDCITLLLNNWIMRGFKESQIETKVKEIALFCKICKSSVIIVSNEVGAGIIPANKLGRLFRDIEGKTNQILAKYADNVYFMIAGIGMKIK